MKQSMNWDALYQENNMGWDRNGISPALNHALAHGLKPSQRVLIPGCGLGHEVIELARRGFDVTGLDIAPTAIQRLEDALRQENLKATLVCHDLFDYQPNEPFDAVYEHVFVCIAFGEAFGLC